MKVIRVTMPDESIWEVPVSVIQESWWEFYKDRDDVDYDFFDDGECIDWAANNMNWSDVEKHARMVKAPYAVDYQDGWVNGDNEVVEI